VLGQATITLAVVVCLSFLLPVFAPVICISSTVVVYHEVVLVQPASDYLLVALFVHSLVHIFGVFDLICVEASLARSTQCSDLGEAISS
jgi:hypothetical protein